MMTTIMDIQIGLILPVVKQLDAPIVTNKINPDHIKNIIAPSINT